MKKTIIISAINFRNGGPLSVLNDCLRYLDKELSSEYNIIALVHKQEIVLKTKNIKFIEFPKSITSYFYRFYYEYIYFKKLSNKIKPYLWLSLHDMTPNVEADIQAVYCHNPSPFYKVSSQEFFLDFKFALFSWFYKYIYQINIKSNNFVVVQQEWLGEQFKKIFNIKDIIVASPNIDVTVPSIMQKKEKDKKVFFYPSFPRVFKNFEVICEAVKNIDQKYSDKLEVILTIDGTENRYSKNIFEKYKDVKNIKFIGLQSRDKVFEIYAQSDCLIFPSKLETWGLPITEFKLFNKPMFVVDLPYAHETVGNYNKVNFFESNDAEQLLRCIEAFLEGSSLFEEHTEINKSELTSSSWGELFNILLINGVNK